MFLRVILVVILLPSLALSAGLDPWKFGMSSDEVVAFKEQGPYKTFSNGDLETDNGQFDGAAANVQFFFEQNKLNRIGVYLYEGTDRKAAAAAWSHAYKSLGAAYGSVETPGIEVSSKSGPVAPEVLGIAAGATVDVVGKAQMAPTRQPRDLFVFASFMRHEVQGKRYYYVIVYFDPRT